MTAPREKATNTLACNEDAIVDVALQAWPVIIASPTLADGAGIN